MNFAAIEDAIFNWVTTVLDPAVTVIWDEPDKPRPESPSARLSFLQGPTTLGLDEIRDNPADPQGYRILGQRTMVLSVMAYGDLSFQIISDLQTSMADPNLMDVLHAVNVSILSSSSMRDVTTPLETKYEKRAQMDFNLLASEDKAITPGTVSGISLESQTGAIEGSFSADNGGE